MPCAATASSSGYWVRAPCTEANEIYKKSDGFCWNWYGECLHTLPHLAYTLLASPHSPHIFSKTSCQILPDAFHVTRTRSLAFHNAASEIVCGIPILLMLRLFRRPINIWSVYPKPFAFSTPFPFVHFVTRLFPLCTM